MLGCGGDQELPLAWEGQHVQVRSEASLDAWCPGTLTRLDNEVGALKDLFGAPDDYLVTVDLYASRDAPGFPCEDRHLACSSSNTASTTELLDRHEIVHAISDAHLRMPRFFEEGAASFWGVSEDADFDGLDIREVLDASWTRRLTVDEYALAAHFTGYLIFKHGAAPYVALFQRAARDQTAQEFAAVFESAVGVPLDASLDDYTQDWPYCGVQDVRHWHYPCSRPATVLPVGTRSTLEVDVSCANADVVGPSALETQLRPDPRIWIDLTVELRGLVHHIEVDGLGVGADDAALVELKACDFDCASVEYSHRTITPETPGAWPLPPGRYVLRVSRPFTEPGPVTVRWLQDE